MNIELLNMDCMDYLRDCEDNAFDLAIVDPPYGIGNFSRDSYTSQGGKGPRVKNNTKFNINYEWNQLIPDPQYFTELKRVSVHQIIWGSNYYPGLTGGAVAWYKGDQTDTVSHIEIAYLSFQNRVDYIHINWQPGFYRKKFGSQIHPCQKPVKLYDWLLAKYANPGDRILDTHLGSGSSAIAAHYGGFDFVGMEIDKDYYDDACKRFKAETAQKKLAL